MTNVPNAMQRFGQSLAVLAAALLVTAPSEAEERPLVAVLDLTQHDTALKRHELQLLSDLARGAALEVIGRRYDIITRENLVDLLKAHGKELEECQGECETETGRLLGAEVVVSGQIVSYAGNYRVNMKVHRTQPPKLLGSEVAKADSNEDLEERVRQVTAALLRKAVLGETGPVRRKADWKLSGAVKVRVVTDPEGAAIRFGPQDGVTPYLDHYTPGRYRLIISKPFYKTITTEITVEPGRPKAEFSYVLEPNYGTLEIDVTPAGATVELDGSVLGTGRQIIPRIALGRHAVVVSHPGYFTLTRELKMASGENRTVSLELVGRKGGVVIRAQDAAGASLERTVRVDSQVVGQTPWRGEVLAGSRRITVAGFAHPKQVVVPEGGVADTVTLQVGEPGSSVAVTRPVGASSRTVGWVLLATAAASGISGGVMLALGGGKLDEVDTGRSSDMTQETALALEDEARTFKTVGWVLVGVGAAAATASAIMFLRRTPTRQTDAGSKPLQFGVSASRDGGMLLMQGGF